LAVRGFRTKIALHVALLVLVSALVTDVLVILVVQGVLTRNHLAQQRVLLGTVARAALAGGVLPGHPSPGDRDVGGPRLPTQAAPWPVYLILHPDGRPFHQQGDQRRLEALLLPGAAATLQSDTSYHENIGLTWAVFWWQAEAVIVAVPLKDGDRLQGAAAAVVPLTDLYEKLRQYNKPVFLYIVLNTVLLSIVGLYRIFRIYLRPIDRIVRQADEYDLGEDIFFTFRQEDDELNRLSQSLNRMLQRISADKHTLRQTVSSLERANQELKQAQAEIVRAEKMASVGRLAAGIAHEIGNPIGIVLGYLDLIRQPDLGKSEHDDFARRAEKEIQRINTIIRQLLDLARPKESVAQLLSVHAVIEEIVGVLTHQPMMTNIRLRTAFNAADDHVWADADQLRQVFLNLLLNAADAICGRDDQSEPRIDIRTTPGQGPVTSQADWITIDFQDNGEGIAEGQLENIFDPFYTTKDPGKGTGLGLSVSYMIIEKLGGTIAVQSQRGQGTTFTIRLPLRFRPTSVEDGGSMHLQIADQSASSP